AVGLPSCGTDPARLPGSPRQRIAQPYAPQLGVLPLSGAAVTADRRGSRHGLFPMPMTSEVTSPSGLVRYRTMKFPALPPIQPSAENRVLSVSLKYRSTGRSPRAVYL